MALHGFVWDLPGICLGLTKLVYMRMSLRHVHGTKYMASAGAFNSHQIIGYKLEYNIQSMYSVPTRNSLCNLQLGDHRKC